MLHTKYLLLCRYEEASWFLFKRLNFSSLKINLSCFNLFTIGFKFAGLQYSKECYCGNSYGSYLHLTDESCSLKCLGNNEQTCGDKMVNSVYEIYPG